MCNNKIEKSGVRFIQGVIFGENFLAIIYASKLGVFVVCFFSFIFIYIINI
jgi:hypothetical protein